MNLVALKAELTNDPLARGYSGMGDEAAANSLNTVNRTINRRTVPTYEIFEAIVATEYDALTTAVKARVNLLLGLSDVLVNGANAQATLLGAFVAGSATRANLIALAKEPCSRGVELGLGAITPSDVADARRLA